MAIQQELVGTVGNETLVGTVGYGGEPPTWGEVLDKPSTFTPSAHRHNLSDINNIDSKQDNIIAGRNIYISSDGKTINALDASSAAAGETTWSNVLGKPDVVANLQYTVNPNLLDNWYFKQAVSNGVAKGSEVSEYNYLMSRWRVEGSYTPRPTATYNNSGVVGAIGQSIPSTLDIQGKTLTGSYLTASGLLNSFTETVDITGGWHWYVAQESGSNDNCCALVANGDNTAKFILRHDSVRVVAAKLEIGTQQTLAHMENGVWVLNEVPDKVEETTKLLYKNDDGSIKMPFVNPNLLDNWYFGNPVNQRGIQNGAAIAAWSYHIDRWSTEGSGTVKADGYMTADKMYQVIPSIRVGVPVTMSGLFSDGTFLTKTGVLNNTGTWHRDMRAESGTKNINIISQQSNEKWFQCFGDIVAAKVEYGTQQTLAHLEGSTWVLNEIPKYVDERIRCSHMNDDGSWKD